MRLLEGIEAASQDLSTRLPSSTGPRPRPTRWASLRGTSAACQLHTPLCRRPWASRLLSFHHYLHLAARVKARHEADMTAMWEAATRRRTRLFSAHQLLCSAHLNQQLDIHGILKIQNKIGPSKKFFMEGMFLQMKVVPRKTGTLLF